MKNIFVDANILLDVILGREFCDESKLLLELPSWEFSFHVSTLTMANIAYIIRKYTKKCELYNLLKLISERVWVDSLSVCNFYDALNLQANDFEDALQYFCAKENGCTFIITRNKKDFSYSDIPTMTPSEFLNAINQ